MSADLLLPLPEKPNMAPRPSVANSSGSKEEAGVLGVGTCSFQVLM